MGFGINAVWLGTDLEYEARVKWAIFMMDRVITKILSPALARGRFLGDSDWQYQRQF